MATLKELFSQLVRTFNAKTCNGHALFGIYYFDLCCAEIPDVRNTYLLFMPALIKCGHKQEQGNAIVVYHGERPPLYDSRQEITEEMNTGYILLYFYNHPQHGITMMLTLPDGRGKDIPLYENYQDVEPKGVAPKVLAFWEKVVEEMRVFAKV